MAGNTDALKQGYEAFGRGDIEAAVELWTDDFTWQGVNAQELPGSGTHEGKEAAVRVMQQAVAAWDEFRLTPDEFVEQGDTVIALGHAEVGKAGRSDKLPFVHVWRFRDGKACRLHFLTDTLESARVLGVV